MLAEVQITEIIGRKAVLSVNCSVPDAENKVNTAPGLAPVRSVFHFPISVDVSVGLLLTHFFFKVL